MLFWAACFSSVGGSVLNFWTTYVLAATVTE